MTTTPDVEPAEQSPSKPRMPSGLGAEGSKLWRSIIDAGYVLRPDEVRLLADAAKEADLIAAMEKELAFDAENNGSYQVTGSQKQPVAHGLVGELRMHRTTLAALLRQLHLPDLPGSKRFQERAQERSEIGRRAARARWS